MDINQKQRAKAFIDRWKNAEGNEDREARSFLIEFLSDVLDIDNPTHVLDFERRVKGRMIDAFYEDMGILIEAKSKKPGILDEARDNGKYGLETPYQQAKWYANELPTSITPRWIVLTDFNEFRIHDLNLEYPENDYITVKLEDLADQAYLFDFFFDKSQSRLVKEKEISVKAGEIVGRLYKSLSAQYRNIDTDKDEQRSLNVLIVRFVFLLYAEDAGILQEHQAFLNYMRNVEPEDMRDALKRLFEVLDTPEDQRDPYLNEKLAAFPYINGSLFAKEDIIIPQFTQQIKYDLLKEASQEFDWSGISPTIFGAAFESTLNPETRREGGMHYTSIENIHKVIDPLFLDDLKAELADIEGEKVEKKRTMLLRQFQDKLASLKILDPACGSGNFLTESYLSLRRLENRVLESLMGQQMGFGFEGDANPIKVSIDQFYGIEINDFAVAVAKTALWIAEEQMMDVTQDILLMPLDFLPLTSNDNIVQGNALRMDWNDVLPANECNFIIGNPPFIGFRWANEEQKGDLDYALKHEIKRSKLDYVVGWFAKAAEYMCEANATAKTAFVSTNSITQGEHIPVFWGYLLSKYPVELDFVYTTFVWDNEASDQAHVHVVVIGFSKINNNKIKYIYKNGDVKKVNNINPYLLDAPTIIIGKQTSPLNDVPLLVPGSQPSDGGNLIFEPDDAKAIVQHYPEIAPFIRRYMMGYEFLNNVERYCLWATEENHKDLPNNIPEINARLEATAAYRKRSTNKQIQEKSSIPWRFDQYRPPAQRYLTFARVSSQRRQYIPIGYMTENVIPGDKLFTLPDGDLYSLGIMSSLFHAAWMRVMAGRLKSDYSYSSQMVYNTFVWPNPTNEQRITIEKTAQKILDIRDQYPNETLADLYDPDKMPSDLLAAHKALDRAVEEAYGVDFDGDEEKIVAHLFKLYAGMNHE